MEPRFDLLCLSSRTLFGVVGDFLTNVNGASPGSAVMKNAKRKSDVEIGQDFFLQNLDKHIAAIAANDYIKSSITDANVEAAAIFPPICKVLSDLEVLKTSDGDDTPRLALAALLTLYITNGTY
jgi:hypothetical protein